MVEVRIAPATFLLLLLFQAPSQPDPIEESLRRFTAVYSLVEERYADPIQPEAQIDRGAIPGMLRRRAAGGALQQAQRRSAEAPAFPRERDLEAAKKLIAQGSSRQAIALLRNLVDRKPGDADARLLLGAALAMAGMRSEAVSELLEAVRLRPDFAPAYNTLGMALSRFAELEAARQAFEKAIELDPRLVEAHVNLALVLAQSKQLDLAHDHVTRAIEIQGNTCAAAYSYYIRGKICMEQKRPEKAGADFEKAIQLRSDYGEAYLELGLSRRVLLDETGAVRAFEKAVQLMPDHPMARYCLGREYLGQGKARQAVEQLGKASRLQPDDSATLYNLNRALRANGQLEEANRVEQKILEVLRLREKIAANSMTAPMLNNEGVELEKAGKVAAALEKYRAALELDPTHPGFRLNLALALCRLGRWEQGISELKEILRLDPNNAEATRALYIAMEEAQKAKK